MDKLINHAGHPTWKIIEFTKLIYHIPFFLNLSDAIMSGFLLSRGISDCQLDKIGPYTTVNSPESHIGPFLNAIDFLIPDGTPVLSARGGQVIEIVESFDEWGDNCSYRGKLNYVTIMHAENGILEFSQYCHLAKGSVKKNGVRLGSRVMLGQPIAKVGKTGWTDRDHLHFIVFRSDSRCNDNPFGFRSLKIKFAEL
jgi:murein DD-endopeptidase MepM/ murein hydrolase activator NlpD